MSRSNTLFKKTSKPILAAAIVFLLVFTAGCAANGLTNRNDQNKPSAGANPTGNAGNPTNPANPTGNVGSPTSAGNPTNPANPTGDAGSPTNAGIPTNTPTSTTDPTGAATPTGEPLVTGEPSPTTPPKKTAEELKKEYGQANVTDITGSTRTDFAFTEDYEGFYDKSKSWTLDLNGNTVVITKPIELKSQLTITNGRLIIACEPGFRLDPEGFKSRLEFSGKKIGPLTVSVIGGVAVYSNVQVYTRACEIEVNGGAFAIPDTLSGWNKGANATFSSGRFEDSKITVFDGCFLLNRDKSTHIGIVDISNSAIYVYENGIGIDNSGDLVESGFTAMPKDGGFQSQVIGGCFIYNRAGGTLDSYSSVYVESGIGVINEGELSGHIDMIVETGTGVLNRGVIKCAIDVSSVPMSLYKGALVINEAGAEIESKGSYVTVYTGENAVGLDNSGKCNFIGHVSVGVPSLKDSTMFTSSKIFKYLSDMFEAFFKGGINAVTGCRGIVNRPEAQFVTSGMAFHVYSSGVTGAKYTDRSLGFFNMTGAHADVASFEIFIHGEDAIGLLNATGAEFIASSGEHRIAVYAKPFDHEVGTAMDFEECFATIGVDSKLAKDCIGVMNESDMMDLFKMNITMCGNGCVGFVNTGRIGNADVPQLKNSTGYNDTIKMFGRGNTGLQNKGTLGCNEEKNYSKSVDSMVYGNENVAVDNSGDMTLRILKATCEGTGSVAFLNTGDLKFTNEGRFSMDPSKKREGVIPENCVLVDNKGSITDAGAVAGFTFDIPMASKGCTAVKNGSGGSITSGNQFYGKSRCALFIDNAGRINLKQLAVEAPEYDEGDPQETRVFVRNSGVIEANDIEFYTQAPDVVMVENTGDIVVTERISIVFNEKYGNSVAGRNDGRIEAQEIELQYTGRESAEFTGSGRLVFGHYAFLDRNRNYSFTNYKDGAYAEVVITYDPETGETTGGNSTSVDAAGNVKKLKYVFDKKSAGWRWVDA